MSDLISRQAVTTTIHNYFKSLIDKGVYKIDAVDCNAEICKEIDCIPTAYDVGEVVEQQLTNGWMPVSERLPEEGRYLVTTVYGEVKESKFDLEKWWQIDNSTISLAWEEEPIKVVAWQPLPPKYEEVLE